MQLHQKFLKRRFQEEDNPIGGDRFQLRQTPLVYLRCLHVAKCPSVYGVSLELLAQNYGATGFQSALSRYIIHLQHPDLPLAEVKHQADRLSFPVPKISVFHRIKFLSSDPFSLKEKWSTANSIHCNSHQHDPRTGNIVLPGWFDTALINMGYGGRGGVYGASHSLISSSP